MEQIKLEDIKARLSNNYDVIYRELVCGKEKICIVNINDLCDAHYISQNIIIPLINNQERHSDIDFVMKEVVTTTSIEEVATLEQAIQAVLTAHVLIVFRKQGKAACCEAKGFPKRGIEIPVTETVIKGPREGFTENIQDNLSAIRRRIKTPQFKVEHFILGKESQTSVAMLYVDGRAPQNIVDFVRTKINGINNKDYIFYVNHIEEALKCKSTPFDTIGYSEKPDVISSKIAEGRVAVIFDGTSFVISAPYFFIEHFQTTDDYTMNKFMANIGRMLRWFAFAISTLLPGLYLALVTYHFRLIPSIFLFRMAIFRGGVPVPTVVELIYMTIFFQIIREAGVRLPQPIGPTLSIVGALILGDAAVSSGLASQVTVVVVAITSIASYLIPKLYIAIFVWNMFMILFAALLGLPGFFMGFILFVAHLAGLTTCGYPYLYPLGTLNRLKYKDVIFRGDLDRISDEILIKDEN
ncbi:MAG: spore germination protein [Eubacteriales bacterium]